jgi:hypothetical protein
MMCHATVATAAFVLAVIAQVAFPDNPRLILAWLSIPLQYSFWLRFGGGLVCLPVPGCCAESRRFMGLPLV